MSTLTQTVHREHEGLLGDVEHIRIAARQMPELSPGEREVVRARVLDFLRDTLVPHAKLEEREIYPKVARILGHPDSTATMTYDHLAIRERTADLADVELEDVARLQELLYGLYALIKVHFWKEEELYLSLLETQGG